MKAQLFQYWDRIRSSFWFLPVVMSAGAVGLAFTTVAVEEPLTKWFQATWDWKFTGGAEGASAVLGTIAGSMITIAGVVFSMTLVALSLASSQFGPRLLRNFMRDTTTQVVLGTFVATFLYCLLVLRTIRRAEEIAFVPHLSVTLGVVMAVLSVGVFIYFIHHVSLSIQANEIVARVSTELIEGIDHLFPIHAGRSASQVSNGAPDAGFLDMFEREARPIGATGDGYLQFVDTDALLSLAIKEDAVIRLERRPGHYVIADRPVVMVWPGDRVTDDLRQQVNVAFALGRERTPNQDIEFAVDQLVEVAVRALSPGVNDPFTAIACIDHLGSALSRLVRRDTPSIYRLDEQDQLRLIAPSFTFPAVADAAFNQIRQYGRTSVAVTIRLLETIAEVAHFAHRTADRGTLLRHAEMIARGARESLAEAEDRRAVDERFDAVCKLCNRLPWTPG